MKKPLNRIIGLRSEHAALNYIENIGLKRVNVYYFKNTQEQHANLK